jgi:hypothetical protein
MAPRLQNIGGGHKLRPCIAINQYLTHYCVVRADIPFGAQAAQLIHAAGYSVSEPIPPDSYAIALHVQNEVELRSLAAILSAAQIDHRLIIESDAPYTDQAMAIGIRPMDRKLLKPFLSSYALVAQPGRASRLMTVKVAGSNPAERSTSPTCACSSSGQSVRSNDPQGTRFDS